MPKASRYIEEHHPSGHSRMILKELDPFNGTEPFELAGRRAEEQMAFYLRRHFGEREAIYVINGLRLERKGDACQIDHLIVHPCGFVAIESKSVTTEVSIDGKGDWSRLTEGTWRGMPSPVNQAKLQLVLLREVLNDFAPEVLGKIFGMEALQMRFGGLQYDAYAAVSDNGIINWPTTDKYETVCKADGISALIQARIESYRTKTGMFGFSKSLFKRPSSDSFYISYSDERMRAVAEHLVAKHAPRVPAARPAAALKPVTSKVLLLPENTPPNPTLASTSACWDCTAGLSPRVMDFCRAYPNRFGGGLYCMKCQPKY